MGNKPAGPQTFSDYYPGMEDVEVQGEQAYIPAAGAADVTKQWPVWAAPYACLIKGVVVVPQAAITGADTHTFHWNLINKGVAGGGTTELANKDFTNGIDAAVMDEIALYAPATYLSVPAGTVLSLQREKIGNGQAAPEALVRVDFIPVMVQ